MNNFIPFALPDISSAEIDSVVETLRSGWITTGPKAKEFETRFASAVGGQFAVGVNSCTAALHLALEAIGVRPGDEVIVPTMTFAATAEVVRYLGATPVLVDVKGDDHNLDPLAAERAITPRTRAIMPVHFAGVPCDVDEVREIAHRRGALVVADAAHAFPAAYRGRNVGTLADITCFSFYATKTITTGEGGAAVTDNAEWAERMRVMSLHGISKDAWKRYSAQGHWYYEIIAPGYKYNLTDIAAAMGLVQLGRADAMRDRRAAIATRYDEALRGRDDVEVLVGAPDRTHAHHLYVIKPRLEALTIDRDAFIVELRERRVGASVHFIPLHMHPYYRDTFGYESKAFPVATSAYLRSISLPIYSAMTDAQVDRVLEALIEVLSRFRR